MLVKDTEDTTCDDTIVLGNKSYMVSNNVAKKWGNSRVLSASQTFPRGMTSKNWLSKKETNKLLSSLNVTS